VHCELDKELTTIENESKAFGKTNVRQMQGGKAPRQGHGDLL